MTGCVFYDDGSIAEDVVVGVGEDHGFAVAETIVSGLLLRTGREHGVTFGCVDQPRGPGKGVCVRYVIEMIVGKGNVGNGLGWIAKGGQLRQQRLGGGYVVGVIRQRRRLV